MKVKAYTINSFAKTSLGGNGAGVVLDADYLSDEEMQKIAAVLGFSETAFVLNSNLADFKVRFFTPSEEVDLCGHATIGTFFTMGTLGYIKPGNYLQETKAGILGVEIKEDQSIMMSQPLPVFFETIDKSEIADSLNIEIANIHEDLPVQIVSTGLRDIIVPIKNLDVLYSIKPDFKKIFEISRRYSAVGYHVFSLETINFSTACCRNFAPLFGIPEESATGTSNGALGCYLYKYGKINFGQTSNIIIEQGYAMKKPSEIFVSLAVEGEKITGVKVGGRALNLSSIEIDIE
ncbi:PhzF family phenazine biosynthesis isomerase [Anaerocolumna sedimenticola]|uniref:PhzF family phenazine biosynthesis isomerase n=1 Tax=Anaerocolumna sedimenticola TaxID=2696063 RepID=A0A6P1TSD3_9FIRM|nr:PhzF family phenazine biosynthesis protein [Anaerocolumna sedimenticola]QHQ63383.1 PhzF family phenazine biosynthesis isomerase [Anaerocolumna sedimenticola]